MPARVKIGDVAGASDTTGRLGVASWQEKHLLLIRLRIPINALVVTARSGADATDDTATALRAGSELRARQGTWPQRR
jgi:hypothetical protein